MSDLSELNARHQTIPPLPSPTLPFQPRGPNEDWSTLLESPNGPRIERLRGGPLRRFDRTLPYPVPQLAMSTTDNIIPSRPGGGETETISTAMPSRNTGQREQPAQLETKRRQSKQPMSQRRDQVRPGLTGIKQPLPGEETRSEAATADGIRAYTQHGRTVKVRNRTASQTEVPQTSVHQFGRMGREMKIIYLPAQLREEFERLLVAGPSLDRQRLAKEELEAGYIMDLEAMPSKFSSHMAANTTVQAFEDALVDELFVQQARNLKKFYLQFCIGCLALTGDIPNVEASKVERRYRMEFRKMAAFMVAICRGLYDEHSIVCNRVLAIMAITAGMCAKIKRLPWTELYETCAIATQSVSELVVKHPAFMAAIPHGFDAFAFLGHRYGITREAMLCKLNIANRADDNAESPQHTRTVSSNSMDLTQSGHSDNEQHDREDFVMLEGPVLHYGSADRVRTRGTGEMLNSGVSLEEMEARFRSAQSYGF